MQRFIQDLFLDLTLLSEDDDNNDHDGDGNNSVVFVVSDSAHGFKKYRPNKQSSSTAISSTSSPLPFKEDQQE